MTAVNPDLPTQDHANACILCSRNCGLTITTQGRNITKIKGDKNHPVSNGYICQKAARLEHYQNHADRLSIPLKRKEDGSFEEVSWDQALSEIAEKLNSVRNAHGGDAFAFVGGGGQGNHIGGAYGQQLRHAMGSRYFYSALAQEKTQDFWVNGRLFGDQRCHVMEDVEHADYVLFIGTNPFQAHGIQNARDNIKGYKKSEERTMVVIDPRFTETAKSADIHLQIKPSTDAYLMSAMLAIIVRDDLHDKAFLSKRCSGFEAVEQVLRQVPIEEYVAKADLDLATVEEVARGFAQAERGCVRIDLGLQHSLNSTLTGYLEKLLYLVTGNFGVKGGNSLHTMFLPLLGNSDERKDPEFKRNKLTAHHKMMPISGMYPPNILPDEIEHEGEDRIRAVWVESANPAMTYADTQAFERAFRKLDVLVVVDVALTETARLADYILPASSQFEKWEATGFNAEFPNNFFHLRAPMFEAFGDTLPEPEIHTRLLEKMGVIPTSFPKLERIAKMEPNFTAHQGYFAALMATLKLNKQWVRYAPSVLYRTFGKSLPKAAEAASILLPLSVQYAKTYPEEVKRAGIKGNDLTLGVNLFRAILDAPAGLIVSKHDVEDHWKLIKNKDGLVHLEIKEMLAELEGLKDAVMPGEEFPYVLMAGERRSYNANQIYRDPAWRKVDKDGALRMHPDDAAKEAIEDGEQVLCKSARGEITVKVEVDDSVRRGMVTLPHGYGQVYQGNAPAGPQINRLTSSDHCDPFTKCPYHKYVPVHILKQEGVAKAS